MKPKRKNAGGRKNEQHPHHAQPKPSSLPSVQSVVGCAHLESVSTATNERAIIDHQPSPKSSSARNEPSGKVFFHRQGKMAGNDTRSDENKGHTHPLTITVRHRSLHGPIKINVSVSKSVVVSVSVHIESRTIHFHFLDFFHSRTNGITP